MIHCIKKLLAFTNDLEILLYDVSKDDVCMNISRISMPQTINYLIFTPSQLFAMSKKGRISCWNSLTQKWLVQEILPFSCCDIYQNLLILAFENGAIKSTDLAKFPHKINEQDILITDVYMAPHSDKITAISVYTRVQYHIKDDNMRHWLELAYGTSSGSVYVIGHHPETFGSSLRVFYSLHAHTMPIIKVQLCEKYLFTVCENHFHVRTWALSRFRDMLNTQPGPTIVSSFNVADTTSCFGDFLGEGRYKGPYIPGDDQCFFVEHIQPNDTEIKIRSAVTGKLYKLTIIF
uniref:SH3KBP1-binding protein 1 (Trinotate prediction) n=1 Tax=Henneguya salminicola TaxID=69463 RepID=A0A6G3MF34_HENSL